MRVLLTGATGLIGRAVLAALHGEGHAVVAVARSAGAADRLPEAAGCVALDIAKATSSTDWLPHLVGIDAVVNCAGVLQDSPRDSTAGVHANGATALFAACEQAGVRRVVQISAIGVDRGATTAFARSKLAGDEALMAHNLEWVILRPSVVVGRQAYGGSALFRGLAALPVMPRVAGAGPLQVVQLDDVVRTVLFFMQPDAPTRVVLEIAGPERLSLEEVLIAYRRWLGFGEARFVTVPGWLVGAACRLGDLIGLLGWRPPLRSTTRRELMRGAVGDPAPWMRLTGIEPARAERRAGSRARLGAGAMVCPALFRQAADTWVFCRSTGWRRGWWRWALARRRPSVSSRRPGSCWPPRWRPQGQSPTLLSVSASPSGAPPGRHCGRRWRCRLPTWPLPRCCCRGCGPTR